MDDVWVFKGNGASNPSAIFSTREKAEQWIAANSLQGMLSRYPVDVSVYDYAIQKGWFTPKRADQESSAFIQRFTSASQEHYHYENGASDGEAENAK